MNTPRVLTVVAVVSVVLNLLLVGFVVGRQLPHFGASWSDGPRFARDAGRDREPRDGDQRRARVMMGPNDLNFFAAARALSPEARKTAEAAFHAEMPAIRENVKTMMEKRRALLDVLAGAPEDIGRVSQALEEVRTAGARAQEHSHKLFLQIAGSLPPAERAAFLKAAGTRGRPPR
jgi:uncharacterized membrane protein